MPKLNLVRETLFGNDVQERIEAGIATIYNVALAAYGANSGNVLIEHRYGEPLISHDGITNVSNLVVSDPVANAAISIVRQASEKTNRNAGDSTTLTIILAELVYENWKDKGLTPREIQRQINAQVTKIVDKIRSEKLKCDPELLKHVARISAGDEGIGELVSDAIETVGKNGSVTVVETPENLVSSEVIDGFTFKKGLRVPALADDLTALKTRYENPSIVVMPKLIKKNEEILPVLDKLINAERTPIVLIADVSGQALETIVANNLKGTLNIAIVEPPAAGRDAFMNDVAMYASTKQFTGNADDFSVREYAGTAESVNITLSETTINGCQTPESLQTYISSIDDSERRERLTGKTVRISVGAATQAERQELKLRIEDAVCAAQTAYEYGVLPGGGAFLRDIGDEYLKKPFELLTDLDPAGFNIHEGINIETDERVSNVVFAGIVDSAKAIEEAVINSHSVAAQLLSVQCALPFAQDME